MILVRSKIIDYAFPNDRLDGLRRNYGRLFIDEIWEEIKWKCDPIWLEVGYRIHAKLDRRVYDFT